MPHAEHLSRAIWVEPRWQQFLAWDVASDLAQATWEWPKKRHRPATVAIVEAGFRQAAPAIQSLWERYEQDWEPMDLPSRP